MTSMVNDSLRFFVYVLYYRETEESYFFSAIYLNMQEKTINEMNPNGLWFQ